jgi:hypothetical protein
MRLSLISVYCDQVFVIGVSKRNLKFMKSRPLRDLVGIPATRDSPLSKSLVECIFN